MKILVTGSSGTIGTRLCERLLESEHDVVGADWEPCKWQDGVEALRIDIDLRDVSQLSKLPTDVDMVIHLAANARVYELVEHPDRAMDNMTSTFNALEYARQNNIPRFVFASSRETYGNIDVESYSEDMARFQECESPYTASKIAGEALTEAYKRCYEMDTIIFRFSNVYGMYDDSVRVLPQFFRQAKANETLVVYGKEKCLDFTYIDDCIAGIMLAIEKWDTAKNDTYNLACQAGASIGELAEQMVEHLGSSSTIEYGPVRTGEVVHYIADITKARKKLGYEPTVPFSEGVKKTVEWYSEHL